MKELAPSLLSADFARLGEQAELVSKHGADYLHIDVMDGKFVSNNTVEKMQRYTDILNADNYVADFVTDKTEYIVVHQEACVHLYRSLQNIKSLGVKAGVALNPATSLCMIEEVLADVDLVLIMSVEPGFGGQKFIEASLDKIERLAKIRAEKGLSFKIEVDGGVSTKNAKKLIEAGADILVAGSAVFGAEDIPARMDEFRKEME